MTAKNQVCLWYDHDAEEAAKLYAATVPDALINCGQAAPGDYPDRQKGKTLMVEMTIMGIPTLLLHGGPTFPQSESFSFQVMTEDQEETDRYWNTIVGNGGQESQCGWCKDKWGLSWQITPRQLMDIYSDPDPAATQREIGRAHV